MTASELRIGNYISWTFDNECYSVSEIFDSEDYLIKTNNVNKKSLTGRPDQLKAILLSEEWLLKLDFKKRVSAKTIRDYIDYSKGNMVCNISLNGVEIEYCAAWQPIDEKTHIATLQHVHQLQNLYFALTGTELKMF